MQFRAALSMLKSPSLLLSRLLEGGHSVIAGRLAGACRKIGRDHMADEIMGAMTTAGYAVREVDPFQDEVKLSLPKRESSPYVNRLNLLWQSMRETVIDVFPEPPGSPKNAAKYLKDVDDIYVTDGYHSLSIEGYQVSSDLIERVRSGNWNPDEIEADRAHRDAMAARGYWQSFQAVHKSVENALGGANAGEIARRDHGGWYRELFGPSVTAGLQRAGDLAGYRGGQVYIGGSMHVPMKREAVHESMEAFFDLLAEEEHPAVRVVRGHFVLIYIHPYMDGNGRIGRFFMNVMLASGGYPWTVIPVEARDQYMQALERASVGGEIQPFASFLGNLVSKER